MSDSDRLKLPDWLQPPTPSLKRGDDDGTSGDMEARVKRLEEDTKELRGDLKSLLIDVAVLKERVSHLPTKGWAVTVAITTVTIIGAIVTLAPKLQAAFNIHP